MALLVPTTDFSDNKTLDFNFTVDWLSFSGISDGDGVLKSVSPVFAPLFDDFSALVKPTKGRFSFGSGYSFDGGLIFYDPQGNSDSIGGKNSFHVILTGSFLKTARSVLLDSYSDWLRFIFSSFRVGRCDLALDIFDNDEIPFIKRQLEEGNYLSIWRNFSLTKSQGDGWTYSLGRRGGASYLRIYDKRAERLQAGDDVPFKSWLRFELELRDSDDVVSSSLSSSSGDVNDGLFRIFLDFIDRRLHIFDISYFDFSHFNGVLVSQRTVDRPVFSIYNSIDWLRNQVLPTIHKLNSLLGPDFMRFLFGYQVSERAEDTIFTYLLEYNPLALFDDKLRDVM